MKKLITILFSLTFLIIGCNINNKVNYKNVDKIELIEMNSYDGYKIDSMKLEDRNYKEFINDFNDKSEDIIKFYPLYIINIHLKNGELISYRTSGQIFEKKEDKNTNAVYFKLNKDINLIEKYWNSKKERFH